MPLIHSKSKKALQKNIETEMKANPAPEDRKQNIAIAYAVKRKAAHKMAKGGAVSAATEKRPSPQSLADDQAEVRHSEARKEHPLMAAKPKIQKLAEGGIIQSKAPFSIKSKVQMDEEEKQRRAEDHSKINDMTSMSSAEEDMEQHPAGLESDNDMMKPSDKEIMSNHMEMLAEGGEVSDEEIIDHAASVAAAIMAKRKMANGGVVDHVDPMHEDDKHLAEGQVDIDDNGREMPNGYYKRNEDDVLDENLDEDMMDMSQPMDSNEHGDDIDSDHRDMVKSIMKKISKKSPISR